MALSNLRGIVNGIAGKKEMKIEDFQDRKLVSIEKELNLGKMTKNEAVEKVRAVFSYHLSVEDYRKIETQLTYNNIK